MISALNILRPIMFRRTFGFDVIQSSADLERSVDKFCLAASRSPALELLSQESNRGDCQDGFEHQILHTAVRECIPVQNCTRKDNLTIREGQAHG